MLRLLPVLGAFILCFVSFQVKSQQPDVFKKDWAEVKSLEGKGLIASAREKVYTILRNAVAQKSEAQQVNAVMHLIRYNLSSTETPTKDAVFLIDSVAQHVALPVTQMLYSLKADMLSGYLLRYNYKIKSRTQVASVDTTDFETWPQNAFVSKIISLYKESINNKTDLQHVPLNRFNDILSIPVYTEGAWVSVYDFLINRGISGLTTIRTLLPQALNDFQLNSVHLFDQANQYADLSISTENPTDATANILNFYQQLIKSHLSDSNPNALIDADINRLKFVYEVSTYSQKDEQYERALIDIQNQFPENSMISEAMFLRASLYHQQGLKYSYPDRLIFKDELKKSVELCEQIINKYPKSYGALKAKDLLSEINDPNLIFSTEAVVIPGEPFKMLVSYNNIKTLYYRIYKVTTTEIRDMANAYMRSLDHVLDMPANKIIKETSIQLKQEGDYRTHRTEIAMNALPIGNYLIVSSSDPSFNKKKSSIYASPLYVSNLAVLFDRDKHLQVVQRNNGQPVSYARVNLWANRYNYKKDKYDWFKIGNEIITDAQGRAEIDKNRFPDERYYYCYFEVRSKKDILAEQESFYLFTDKTYSPQEKAGFLFTDRAIYRPGQKVFFKGILYRHYGYLKKEAAANVSSKIIVFDVNQKEVKSISVQTNEFGSYSGSFDLPSTGITGMYHIKDELYEVSQYFSVEEYKRPTFKVDLDQPKGNYRVGDSIQITGSVMAYAGNSISGAKVVYHIRRTPRFPDWWYYYRIFNPTERGAEIASGELTTDEAGNFNIPFNALPDLSIDKKDQPIFNYEVNVDVTDINGETRSATTSVSAAYQSFVISIDAPKKIKSSQIQSIKVFSKNLSGQYVPASAQLTLYRLNDPHKIYKPRYWSSPDIFTMTKQEHDLLFPNDPYAEEDKHSNWQFQEKAMDSNDSTRADGSFIHISPSLKSGWYKMIVQSKDSGGDTIHAEKILMITDNNGAFSGTLTALDVAFEKDSLQPGDKNRIFIKTGFDKIYTAGIKNNSTGREFYYSTSTRNKPEALSIRADSLDLGGIGFSAITVMNNRIYTSNASARVPWIGKQLNIRYETFRDKLEPGSKETWTLHISEKVPENRIDELLVNMYDASLDQIVNHKWVSLSSLWPENSYASAFSGMSFRKSDSRTISFYSKAFYRNPQKRYPDYIFGFSGIGSRGILESNAAAAPPADLLLRGEASGVQLDEAVTTGVNKNRISSAEAVERKEQSDNEGTSKPTDGGEILVRTNFNETALFYPQIKIDSRGYASFSFTMPEALTRWKLMSLVHTPDMASGYDERFVVTQKKLMVQPNLPRFTREGDRIEIPVKVVNLNDQELSGTASLELFDATTNKPVDGLFQNQFPEQQFSVSPGQSVALFFPIAVPVNFNSALKWKIKASTSDKRYSDGEQNILPVLSNRILVTETLPMYSSRPGKKNYRLTKLTNLTSNSSISSYRYTLEYSSNPAWYAVQALPYLMEYPYECSEQTFNRFYANSIASGIINQYPKIKNIFEQWKTNDSSALLSNLEKNQELKSALLEETPWVLQSKNESERKQRIAMLFNIQKLGAEQMKAMNKVINAQNEDGGFSWFKGGKSDRYITQYILSGIGHLKKLGFFNDELEESMDDIISQAIAYTDKELAEEYALLIRNKVNLKENHLSYSAIQFLYMRSFFSDIPLLKNSIRAFNYYTDQSKTYWLSQSKYMQGMIALAKERTGDHQTASAIIRSLREFSINSDEMGMYWTEFSNRGYYWYQSPIESQAMMIEAFSTIDKNPEIVNNLKNWLLRNKQTTDWGNTRATAEACYALLLQGFDWLSNTELVKIQLAGKEIDMGKPEAGTGYQQKTFLQDDIRPDMGNISVEVPGDVKKGAGITWGSAYWQYFEDQDKVTSASTNISITKKMMIEKNSERGPILTELKQGETYQIGDKVIVRLIVHTDRDMEYVHLKDVRAAALEPGNILSGYKWQDGLGYYQSSRDMATHFFFSWLPKGTYVFEYPAFVSHTGDFSSGIASIQCMYAPEFSAHTAGERISVEH